MSQKLKLLIAYDGSECADAALLDLARAGLPPEGEALVLSVAELWLPPWPDGLTAAAHSPEVLLGDAAEAERLAERARDQLTESFPAWRIRAEACSGSPAWEILKRARAYQSNLVVVGSHGRSALGRFFLGSTSLKVVTEAQCTVRVGRPAQTDSDASRIIIGLDNSIHAQQAVETVARRVWPPGSQALLITAIGPFSHRGLDLTQETNRAGEVQRAAKRLLQEGGLEVFSLINGGDPKLLLVNEATNWPATSLFVGSRGRGPLGRMLLGSVSSAVVTRAPCSVEVVR